MRVKNVYSSVHELKKMSYALFQHLHELERANHRRSVLISRHSSNGPFVVLFLRHMRVLMEDVFKELGLDEDCSRSYLSKLEYLTLEVEMNCASSKALGKHLVGRLLTEHTRTFNRLKDNRVHPTVGEEWDRALLSALAAWGDSKRL